MKNTLPMIQSEKILFSSIKDLIAKAKESVVAKQTLSWFSSTGTLESL